MSLDETPSNGGWSGLLSPHEREVALLVSRGLRNRNRPRTAAERRDSQAARSQYLSQIRDAKAIYAYLFDERTRSRVRPAGRANIAKFPELSQQDNPKAPAVTREAEENCGR
jgi:hypothetical protein